MRRFQKAEIWSLLYVRPADNHQSTGVAVMTVRLATACAATVLLAAIAAPAQQPQGAVVDGKTAVINAAVFPEKIGELKQKYEQVNSQFKDRFERLQALDKEVKDLESRYTTQQATLSAAKERELREEIELKKRRGQRDSEDFQADYNKALDGATKPVRDKLAQSIQSYASTRGIVLIIRLPEAYQSGMLAFSSAGIDITDDFINEYNRANPVPAGATSAPKPTTPTQPAKPGGRSN
jgi:Skp family chaperone for outer membrane proteins